MVSLSHRWQIKIVLHQRSASLRFKVRAALFPLPIFWLQGVSSQRAGSCQEDTEQSLLTEGFGAGDLLLSGVLVNHSLIRLETPTFSPAVSCKMIKSNQKTFRIAFALFTMFRFKSKAKPGFNRGPHCAYGLLKDILCALKVLSLLIIQCCCSLVFKNYIHGLTKTCPLYCYPSNKCQT